MRDGLSSEAFYFFGYFECVWGLLKAINHGDIADTAKINDYFGSSSYRKQKHGNLAYKQKYKNFILTTFSHVTVVK